MPEDKVLDAFRDIVMARPARSDYKRPRHEDSSPRLSHGYERRYAVIYVLYIYIYTVFIYRIKTYLYIYVFIL